MLVELMQPVNDGFTRFEVGPFGGLVKNSCFHIQAVELLFRGKGQGFLEFGVALDDTIIDSGDLTSPVGLKVGLVTHCYTTPGDRVIVEYDQVVTFRDKFPCYLYSDITDPSCAVIIKLVYEVIPLPDTLVIALNRMRGIARYEVLFQSV